MNRQGRLVNGKVVGGIEWLKTVLPDGTERCGYTWNPVRGCPHGCEWIIDGKHAECYAKTMADRIRAMGGDTPKEYANGFDQHYWRPEVLDEPFKLKTPVKIFPDSMSDLLSANVPDDQLMQVMDACRRAHWHSFLMLTKNAPRYMSIYNRAPENVWFGASTPPDFMHGKFLKHHQQKAMLRKIMNTFDDIRDTDPHRILWLSAEPLSWDITPDLEGRDGVLDWIVIGAASNGKQHYPPVEDHVVSLIDWCDRNGVKVFFKGNMDCLPYAADHWREEFPRKR